MTETDANKTSPSLQTDSGQSSRQDEYLEWLKFDYRNIHDALWEAHKVFWTMTSILVPVAATALGYLVTQLSEPKASSLAVIIGTVVIGITLFWYGTFWILYKYNVFRLKKLEKIENAVNKYFEPAPPLPEFRYYSKDEEGQSIYRVGPKFKIWTSLLALFVVVVTLILMLVMQTTECLRRLVIYLNNL